MSVSVKRFYLGCLAHASYFVESEGIAAVIDPQRDVDLYLETAAESGAKIQHVILTHLHADFVSGHLELAERTGAKIYLGADSGAHFPHIPARDGDTITFGQAHMEFRHTPGHTLESISIVLTDLDAPAQPKCVFTGDTLFIGDVGRPDLSPTHTPVQLAELLYHSLHDKLLSLPDETEVFPAHGAGSLCGRQMSNESSSTIGKQRLTNYALLARTPEEFVHLLTDHLPPRPEYFAKEVELNRQGARPIEELPQLRAFTADEVRKLQAEGAVIVDTRPAMQFAVAHVPGSLHIALTGQYASWAARILGLDRQLIISGEDPEHVRESQIRLARVGVENVAGYLEGGIAGWIQNGQTLDYIPHITAQEFQELLASEGERITIVDVREPAEFEGGAIPGAVCIPLGQLEQRASELDPGRLNVVHCKGGYRSSIAASILRRAGLQDIANLTGGYDAWVASQRAATA